MLTALLRRLGVESDPVLVNTAIGVVLDQSLPHMSAFDHCIVGLRIEGVRYWVDPTQFPQGGRLGILHQARFGWALPLVANAKLEDMGQAPFAQSFNLLERFELPSQPSLPGRLTLSTAYRGWRADAMRRRIESGVASLSRDYIDYYTRLFGTATELEPLKITDDLDENLIVISESYEIARLWERSADGNDAVFETVDDLFRPHLTTARSSGRRWPIDLGLPRQVSSETIIHVPGGAAIKAWARIFEMDGLRAMSECAMEDEGKVIRLKRRVDVRQQFLPAADAEEFFDLRDEAFRSSGVVLARPVKNGVFPKPSDGGPWSGWLTMGSWFLRGLVMLAAFGGLHFCSSPPT